jgi:hypothetical protein
VFLRAAASSFSRHPSVRPHGYDLTLQPRFIAHVLNPSSV